jgi:hypothetical protein
MAATINGLVPHTLVSAAGVNLTSVASYSSMIFMGSFGNQNASPRWIKFFDTASAVSVGVTTPILNFIIPGNTAGAGSNIPISTRAPWTGLQFQNGIQYAITGAIALLDNTPIASGDVCINIGYINLANV